MVSVNDVPADEFVVALASHFKTSGKIQLPKWHDIVKTSPARQLPPTNPDWYYVRVASVARKIYTTPNMGIGALARAYGGHQKIGVRRGHFREASTGILRNALQQLEKAGLVSKGEKGRTITKAGQRELDTLAGSIYKKNKVNIWKSTF